MTNLAQKLSAHPKLKWEAGMRVLVDGRPLRLKMGTGGFVNAVGEGTGDWDADWPGTVKIWLELASVRIALDLNDNPTIGAIEGQVREICPQARLYPPENPGEPWVINDGIVDHLAEGATRGEVWAQAFLEVVK